jgi:hypothetical protein
MDPYSAARPSRVEEVSCKFYNNIVHVICLDTLRTLNADKKNEIFAADHGSIETHTGPVIAQHQFYNYNTGS